MITHHDGNLLESNCDIICHQVNLQGFMGGGLALQIATVYPNCEEEYRRIIDMYDMRGDVHFFCFSGKGCGRYIANCFSQEMNFDTNYAWVKSCFTKVLKFAEVFNCSSIGIPRYYGCGIANGNWNIVENIIKQVFENEKNIDVSIWDMEGDVATTKGEEEKGGG